MKLSEKLFLLLSVMISLILTLIFVLAALQKQGIIEFSDGISAEQAWNSLGDQWKDWMEEPSGTGDEAGQGVEDNASGEAGDSAGGEAGQETGDSTGAESGQEAGDGAHGEAMEGETGKKDGDGTEDEAGQKADEESEGETGQKDGDAAGGAEDGTEAGTESPPQAVIDISRQETVEEDPYPYYIKVNKKQNCITVYEKDSKGEYTVPVKAMICSTGYATPLGVFGSKGKYVMKGLINGVFGQYSTWITGNILFHSVPSARATKDSVSVRNYNQLGTTASAGCVRLTVADAKWIYDKCEIGTLIEIYEAEEPGPLGKPEAVRLPEGSNWDPTDPDPENPWHEYEPCIETEELYYLYWGEEWKPYEDIKAYDTCGNDITERVELLGEVDSFEAGYYDITLRVTDAVGKTAAGSCRYLVLPVPWQGAEPPTEPEA